MADKDFAVEYEFKLKVKIGDIGGPSKHNTREAVKPYLLRAIQAYGDLDTNDWAWYLKDAELE